MLNKRSLFNFSEFELIEIFSKKSCLKNSHKIIVPPGDDAFVGKIGDTMTVVTTDTLTENTDFKISWYKKFFYAKHFNLNYKQLGIKLARINLSDLFSMGAVEPLWAVGTFILNSSVSKKNVLDIFYSIKNELKKYNCHIVGGDISKSKELSFSLTLIGLLKKYKKPIQRNTFNIGDYICVTGTLGDSFAGLKILQNPKYMKYSKLKDIKYLVNRHLYPTINYKNISPIMSYITSLTDISDGLYKNLELMTTSRKDVVIKIDLNKIPVSNQLKNFCIKNHLNYHQIAISGGEDYEFLFTISPYYINRIKNKKNVSVIGQITANTNKSTNQIKIENLCSNISFKSYDHFI